MGITACTQYPQSCSFNSPSSIKPDNSSFLIPRPLSIHMPGCPPSKQAALCTTLPHFSHASHHQAISKISPARQKQPDHASRTASRMVRYPVVYSQRRLLQLTTRPLSFLRPSLNQIITHSEQQANRFPIH